MTGRKRRNRSRAGKRMWIRLGRAFSCNEWHRKYGLKSGDVLEVETDYLFNNQFNTAPKTLRGRKIPGLRIMERDVAEVINDQRRGRAFSRWSHKHGPAKGPGAAAFQEQESAAIRRSKWSTPEERAAGAKRFIRPFRIKPYTPAKGYRRGWKSGGVVQRTFKNGNVLLTNGVRLTNANNKGRGPLTPGAKLYMDEKGSRYFPQKDRDGDWMVWVIGPTGGGDWRYRLGYFAGRPVKSAMEAVYLAARTRRNRGRGKRR